MKKLVITLVIEATENDIHEIKGKIIETASESLVSCKVDTIEPVKELKLDMIFNDNIDPYEICPASARFRKA